MAYFLNEHVVLLSVSSRLPGKYQEECTTTFTQSPVLLEKALTSLEVFQKTIWQKC